MSIAEAVRAKQPAAPPVAEEQRFLLHGISWQAYEVILQALGERPVRLTYDRGNLELMTLSRLHEIFKWLLGQFVVVLADELNLPLSVGGSMTFRREDLERGLEPDECYWIRNSGALRGRSNLDFTQDPPPDLVVEVEITRSLIDRLAILAALRVAEVWRFNGTLLQVGQLQPDGQYQWGETSPTFPLVPLPEVARFLQEWQMTADQLSIVRSFRAWVRELLRSQEGGQQE